MTIRRTIWAALIALLALLPLLAPLQAQAQATEQCFPETGFCSAGPILRYWRANGGLPVFGYPIGPQRVETVEGRTIAVQWFERDRLEIQADGQITAGRLGARFLELTGRPWQRGMDMPYNPDCTFVAETGHNMCGLLRAYWQQNGGLARFGYPITDPIEELIEGRPYWVQYFERRRMEYHPTQGGTSEQAMMGQVPATVLLGLLGREVAGRERPTGCHATLPEIADLLPIYQGVLGCPTAGARAGVPMVEMPFMHGLMLWVANEDVTGGRIYVVVQDASSSTGLIWRSFPDTYVEGEPVNTDIMAPPGTVIPVRGFGKLWRDNEWVRGALGYGVAPERAEVGGVQPFLDGRALMLYRAGIDRALVLLPLRNSGAAGEAQDVTARQ